VKAVLAAQDIGAWFRQMPWRKGDSDRFVADSPLEESLLSLEERLGVHLSAVDSDHGL
jgi:hypothetical protein